MIEHFMSVIPQEIHGGNYTSVHVFSRFLSTLCALNWVGFVFFQAKNCDMHQFPDANMSLSHKGCWDASDCSRRLLLCLSGGAVGLRKKLGVKIEHIIGENHKPLLLWLQLIFLLQLTLYNPVLQGKQFCWAWMREAQSILKPSSIGFLLHC